MGSVPEGFLRYSKDVVVYNNLAGKVMGIIKYLSLIYIHLQVV